MKNKKNLLTGICIVLISLFAFDAYAQDIQVKGMVKDKAGEPIPGVVIQVKGTNVASVSDQEGHYSIPVSGNSSILDVSILGFLPQHITVGSRSVIDIVMEEDITDLEEVVVVGYGTTKKHDLTGAITTVKASDVSYMATSNIGQSLQGKVSGMQVSNSARPGSSPVIRIRGLASVKSNSDPLYVVDGVLTNDISFLGNNDIETISVLKDASSSAIYGVRAANGVVIITTKKGSKGHTNINFSGYFGISKIVNMFEMANGSQYIELLNEKGKINGARSGSTYTPINASDYPASTNWYGEILRETGYSQSYDLNISGGSDKVQYAIGAGYLDQEGMVKGSNYARTNLRSSVDIQPLQWLKIGYSANLSVAKTDNTSEPFQDAYVAPPCIAPKGSDGKYNNMQVFGDFANPAAQLEYYNNKSKDIRGIGSVYAEIEFTKDLKFKSSYGVDADFLRQRDYNPAYYISQNQKNDISALVRQTDFVVDRYFDNTLTYQTKIKDDHRLTIMAGISSQEKTTELLRGSRMNVPDIGDNTLYLRLGDDEGQLANDAGSKIRSLSYFGRASYAYQDKYLFTGTIRRDGSSLFPENNRWGTFSSVGLGWILTQENFMKNQKIFDHLKVRFSWGELGNSNVPQNTTTSYVYTGGYLSTMFGGQIAQGANITYVGPKNLKWERTAESDFAIEGYSLNNRFNFELDLYYKKTKDAIFPVTVNSTLGAYNTTYLDNNADLLNKGLELTLGWTDKAGNVGYRISGNFAYNHNEVTALKEGTVGIYGGWMNVNSSNYTVVGHSIGEFYGRKVIGIFQNQNEIDSYTHSGNKIQPDAQPGDFKYADLDNNGVIDSFDRDFLGSPLPKYTYGLSLGLDYKNFDLTIDIYGQGGNKIYNAKRFRQVGNENYDLDFYNNRWRGEGTSNTYPSADMSAQDNKVVNSWNIEKGDFFRIRNIQIGYTIPSSLLKKIGIKQLRVYANALNPLTCFSYKGFSPEITRIRKPDISQDEPGRPIDPDVSTNQGLDNSTYPSSAVYNLGININF